MAIKKKTAEKTAVKSKSTFKLQTPPQKRDALEPRTKAKSQHLGRDVVVEQIHIGKSTSKPGSGKWDVSDFKSADYNPRYISDTRLKKLKKSIEAFGDLSGVVFNKKTKRLISGHQRLKTLIGVKTFVKTMPHTDEHGTVEIGHVMAHTSNGLIKIPLRIVDWSEEKVEKAANIAANSHGGEFDKEKLRSVLNSLETKTFDIELLGLDPLTISSLIIPQADVSGTGRTGTAKDGGEEEFKEYDENSFELSHCCPRCNYKFDSKGKEVKPKKIAKSAKPEQKTTKSKPTKPAAKVTKKSPAKSSKKPVKKIGITRKAK
jgi:hypothetical protein